MEVRKEVMEVRKEVMEVRKEVMGVDLEVVSVLHMGWVGSQELMAWVMALLMALHMASRTMALAPMASLKVMASNLMPMASSLLHMVILLRVMDKHSLSNLLDISLLNS